LIVPNFCSLSQNDADWNERIKNVAETKLSALPSSGVREISYVYDMGDNWQHRIIVEKLKAAEPEALYPQFLGGERRCPPEDCGGIPGYYEFLNNIASKQNKKRQAALDWYGRPYDPDEIDEQQIITALNRLANTIRPSRRNSRHRFWNVWPCCGALLSRGVGLVAGSAAAWLLLHSHLNHDKKRGRDCGVRKPQRRSQWPRKSRIPPIIMSAAGCGCAG
jgi:hypothetical protein